MVNNLDAVLARSESADGPALTLDRGDPAAGENSASSARAGATGRGPIPGSGLLALGGLGIAAGVTIAAFFGLALVLVTMHPIEPPRPAPASSLAAPAGASAAPIGGEGRGAVSQSPDRSAEAMPGAAALATAMEARRTPPKTAAPQIAAAASAVSPLPVDKPAAPAVSPVPAPTPDGAPAAAAGSAAAPPAPRSNPVGAGQAAATADVAGSPSAPRSAATAPLTPAEITTLLTQGDDAFREGDLTSARLYYLRAFGAGDGRGALGIGASYDPEFLRRFHLWTQKPDPAEARAWYLRAQQLGAAGADGRLAKLNEKAPQ
jgi:hypothetical protein